MFALPLIGWIWNANAQLIAILAGLGIGVAIVGMLLPRTLKPVFLSLMLVTAPIGMALGEVAMLVIYFGVFLPIGLVFRLMRRDALRLRMERGASTFWRPKEQPRNAGSYYRQS